MSELDVEDVLRRRWLVYLVSLPYLLAAQCSPAVLSVAVPLYVPFVSQYV